MMRPLISVIIPTYNRSKFLKEAIESVVNQTYKNVEILVIDDGSDMNYAEGICEDLNNCNYHYKKNGGISSSRNYGIDKAKGDFIAFLDDDDLWKPNKIKIQLNILDRYPKVDLVHSSAEVIDEEGRITGQIMGASKNKVHKRSGYVFWNALGSWLVKAPTPLIRRKVFDDGLRFDETILAGEDLDFYNRLFYRHKVYYIQEPLAYYRVYNDDSRLSTQTEKYEGLEWKLYNNLLKMGISNPITKYRIASKLLNRVVNKQLKHSDSTKPKITILDKLLRPKSTLKLLTKNAQRI